MPTTKQEMLSWYRTMQLIRQCEEQLARCHQRGLVHGACHTYVGQEAIAVGVCAHLRADDVVFSTHRGHGHALAKGLPPVELIAELFGRDTGCSRGRGGSMHLFAPEVGLMGTSGIVGPCILQAAGAGYSFKLLKTDQVAVAFFGDGAVNNGAFHEGLNMASIWKLPVLFVCENNQFATEVPFPYAAGNPSVALRGAAYGMPGVEVDGNDVAAVYRAADEAVERARAGGGPTLIECKTYRTRPHAEGMGDYTYRTREEVAAWRDRCPIKRLRSLLIADQVATGEELDAIDAEVQAQVAAAAQAAEQAPLPDGSTATQHVYCEKATQRCRFLNQPQEIGKSDLLPLRSKRWTLRWRASPASSSWAKASARGAATSPRRRVYSPSTAPSASATRRSASAASSASAAARR